MNPSQGSGTASRSGRRPWTRSEDQKLRREYAETSAAALAAALHRSERSVYIRARLLGLSKTREYMAKLSRENGGGQRIAPWRRRKGQAPWNAGMKGWNPEGSRATHFKPGHKPQTWVPIGTVVRDPDGYLKKKVADTRNRKRDWKFLHVLLWEKYRGKVPRGKLLIFKDRNKENIRIGNLLLVTRAELLDRNRVQRLPKAVRDTIYALTALKRRIRNDGKY